jgi:hypothetical protein
MTLFPFFAPPFHNINNRKSNALRTTFLNITNRRIIQFLFDSRQVIERIRQEKQRPIEHGQTYTKQYEGLITGKAETELDAFIADEHSFDEFSEVLRRYAQIMDKISMTSIQTLRLGMFEVTH